MKRFKRHETDFTIATLWEFKSLDKINWIQSTKEVQRCGI